MGQRPLRVVLDTNVIISSFVFNKELSVIRDSLREGKIVPVFSRETYNELIQVLNYEKFHLSKERVYEILSEITKYSVLERKTIKLQKISFIDIDPDDIKFLECAVAGKVDYVVTGDKLFLEFLKIAGSIVGIEAITTDQFVNLLKII